MFFTNHEFSQVKIKILIFCFLKVFYIIKVNFLVFKEIRVIPGLGLFHWCSPITRLVKFTFSHTINTACEIFILAIAVNLYRVLKKITFILKWWVFIFIFRIWILFIVLGIRILLKVWYLIQFKRRCTSVIVLTTSQTVRWWSTGIPRCF